MIRGGPVPAGWIAWCPQGLPNVRTMAIVSSWPSTTAEGAEWWINALRTALDAACQEGRAIVTGAGTTTHQLVHRACERYCLPRIELAVAPAATDPDWLSEKSRETAHLVWPIWLIPVNPADQENPVDGAVVAWADQVRVLKIRRNGRIWKALRHRARISTLDGAVWVLDDSRAARQGVRGELESHGAVRWIVATAPADPDASVQPEPVKPLTCQQEAPSSEEWNLWFCHWTRAPAGPRPGESGNAWLDRLLSPKCDPLKFGPLAALRSIVAGGSILGSRKLTRDSLPVVSWTAVPLNEFRSRRIFRPHLHRWDFELAGIAVRGTALQSRGARPVVYGDASVWDSLADHDRPWFQHTGGDGRADWTAEREWRTTGDFDLKGIPVRDVLVFVPDEAAAARIRPFSRWEVIVVP